MTTLDIHTMNQRNSEYEIADMLEDDTLRLLDDLYHDNYVENPSIFAIQAETILKLVLRSTTAADHLLMPITTLDGDIISELAIDWLQQFGAGDDSGAYFTERIIQRITNNEYTLSEED